MARYEKFGHLFRLYTMLLNNRRGLTVKQVAEALEVHRRTARRYLRCLTEEAGVPAYSENQGYRGRVWRLPDDFRQNTPTPLSDDELTSLLLARCLLGEENDQDPASRALSSLVGKLVATQPTAARAEARDFQTSFQPDAFRFHIPGDVQATIHTLMQAMRSQRLVSMDYRNWEGEETRDRHIAPRKIFLKGHQTYLHAWCLLRGQTRNFQVFKMQNVRLLPQAVPAELRDYDEDSTPVGLNPYWTEPVEVLLEVEEWLADYLRRYFNLPGQEVFREGDAWRARFHVCPDWTTVWWLSQFGPNVQVLEPGELRQWIGDYLNAAADQYI